jgi:hypothetical protein
MNSLTVDRLYQLLPEIYRLRDATTGYPLKALLAIVESELRMIEADVSDLYENWFIETCAEWVVPYIGDLLDSGELYAESRYGQQQRRAYVANTLAYRRRKGTTPVLEQLVRDVTDWRARAVEFFQLLAATQNLNHPRLAATTVDLRANRQSDLVGTPFQRQVAYTSEVRRVGSTQAAEQGRLRGRYQVSNIGLFAWRLQSYPLDRVLARSVAGPDPKPSGRYYTFNPIGYEQAALFNQPQTEIDLVQLAAEMNVPAPLRCAALERELHARRTCRLAGTVPTGISYFDSDPVLQIFINGQPQSIPPEEIAITSLRSPDPDARNVWKPSPDTNSSEQEQLFPAKVVAVDPEMGRLAFLGPTLPKQVEVSYLYGFSGDLGGGPYGRDPNGWDELLIADRPKLIFQAAVEQATSAEPNPLATAVQVWNRTVEAWQKLLDGQHVPLAQVSVSPIQVTLSPIRRPTFSPGIVGDGFQIEFRPESGIVVINSGVAVDNQGRRIELITRQRIQLQDSTAQLSHQEQLLILAYKPSLAGQAWLVDIVPQSAVTGYPIGAFIPLARLIPTDPTVQIDVDADTVRYLEFTAGIVSGLQVITPANKLEAIVTAGTAVDQWGEPIVLTSNYRVDLRSCQGRQCLVIKTSFRRDRLPWAITLVSPEDFEQDQLSDQQYILLAQLNIPTTIELEVTPISADSPLHQLPKTQIDGLKVQKASTVQARITIETGTATNQQHESIELNQNCELDLSAFAGQELWLFVARRVNQGLPGLEIVDESIDTSWQCLGVVPILPIAANTGVITIKDNGTYRGDLNILIPPDRQLMIVADTGDRPHLQGNFTVQGTTATDNRPFSTLTLSGLLIEGGLTVLPGRLSKLELNHCTLIPQFGGLIVQSDPPASDCNDQDTTRLLALILYYLALLQQIIRVGAGWEHPSPQQNLVKLSRLAIKQVNHVCDTVQRALQRWQSPGNSDQDTESGDDLANSDNAKNNMEKDNERLSITLNRCICGAIQLANTVPTLSITDSIIDAKGDEAIVAFGTDVDIQTTTTLGRTLVRSLEAGNSIFTSTVTALRQQVGCLRFCHVPIGSQTPRRYFCQPDRSLIAALDTLPAKLTALVIAGDRRYLGTAGNGIFQWHDNKWQPLVNQPNNRNIISLFAEPDASLLLAGTAAGGLFRSLDGGESWTPLSLSNANTKVVAIFRDQQTNQFFAGTAGNGVYASIDGQIWTLIDRLKNLNVTAIQSHPNGYILVGTIGRGVLCYEMDSQEVTDLNQGLTNLNVTALVVDGNGDVIAGTAGGGVFRLSSNQLRWSAINTGLTNLTVTALAVHSRQVRGTIASESTAVTGNETRFQQELNPTDLIIAFEQTKVIDQITSDQALTIDSSFCPDLPPETPFTVNNPLFVATADGKLFQAIDGQIWKQIQALDDIPDISLLVVYANNKEIQDIFVGTVVGSLWQYRDQRWMTANQGLPKVEEALLIISRLQPRFTEATYGEPNYVQLRQDCATEIRTGAEDSSEMGAFNFLKQAQREANLQASLKEYLRFGMEAGIFYIT